jgi:ElaB/YqjD/DUF883 family membrane-anchored ribosome-binding protein
MREGDAPSPPPVDTRDADIDALRAKMRQLESFDEVIAESVRRTRAMLEEAAELRDRARSELAEARAGIERDRAELVAVARRILDEMHPASPDAVTRAEAVPSPVAEMPRPATPESGRNSTIIVQGVTRPAVATGLRAHLMAQPGVTAVDPREFAEGVLRLQVVSMVPITEALFHGWNDGAGLTVVHQPSGAVEVILPGA